MGPTICEAQGKMKRQAPHSEGTEQFTRVTAECPTSVGPPKPSRRTGTETQRGAGGPPLSTAGLAGKCHLRHHGDTRQSQCWRGCLWVLAGTPALDAFILLLPKSSGVSAPCHPPLSSVSHVLSLPTPSMCPFCSQAPLSTCFSSHVRLSADQPGCSWVLWSRRGDALVHTEGLGACSE